MREVEGVVSTMCDVRCAIRNAWVRVQCKCGYQRVRGGGGWLPANLRRRRRCSHEVNTISDVHGVKGWADNGAWGDHVCRYSPVHRGEGVAGASASASAVGKQRRM